MKMLLRSPLVGVLIFILLMSACASPDQTPPTPVGTILSTAQVTSTATPTSTLTNETPTAFIPITGMDVVSLQCQFCVNEEAHAVLIMSDQVFFNVSDPGTGTTCLTAQEVNGRRILLCRGAQQTSFQLNVCVDDANCLQFSVTLQPCPLIPQTGLGTPMVTFTPIAPIMLTPINTLIPSDDETDEPPPAPRPTRTPGVTRPPASTTTPPPASTTEPPPTQETTEPPPPTEEPTDPPVTEEPTEPPTDPP